MLALRPYQTQAVADIRAAYRTGSTAVCYQLPTGGGKSLVFAYIAQAAALKDKRIWVVVHRKELVRQASRLLDTMGLSHGVIAAGYTPYRIRQIQVSSVQTLVRRLETCGAVDLLVVDECHHVLAGSYRKILEARPAARVLGVTATPARLDGRGLGEIFQTLVVGPAIPDLVAGNFLAPTITYAPPPVADLSGLHIRAGDFEQKEIAAKMDKPTITGDAIAHYRRLCNHVPAIAFTVSRAHAAHVAAQFKAGGYRFENIDGTMPDDIRDQLIRRLGFGDLDGLVSCELIGEGVDIPVCGAAILLRPTASMTVHLQQIGRVMRPAPGKTRAVILDHVGNTLRHGLPDEPREWSLEGKRRKVGAVSEHSIKMRQCEQCYCVHPPAPQCPECGYVYPVIVRQPEQVEGELRPMSVADVLAIREARHLAVRRARTREELLAIAKARGYKSGWVQYVLHARRGRQGARA